MIAAAPPTPRDVVHASCPVACRGPSGCRVDATLPVAMVRPRLTLHHLTALLPTQHDILALLGFTSTVYASIEHYVPQPP